MVTGFHDSSRQCGDMSKTSDNLGLPEETADLERLNNVCQKTNQRLVFEMFLIYTDEAGNTGFKADPDQPIHMICALIVPADCVPEINKAVTDVLRRFLPSHSLDAVEIHGCEIFGGKRQYKDVNPQLRIDLVHALVDTIIRHELRIGYAAVDKMRSKARRHPHELAFGLLAERLQEFLDKQQAIGLIIADENHEIQRPVIEAMRNYQNDGFAFGGPGKPMHRIIDTVHFIQSSDNRVLQLADLATFFLCKAQRIKDALEANPRGLKANENAVLDIADRLSDRLIFERIFPR